MKKSRKLNHSDDFFCSWPHMTTQHVNDKTRKMSHSREHVVKETGEMIINALQPILLEGNKISKRQAVARALSRLALGDLGENLLRAATWAEDPLLFISELWNRVGGRSRLGRSDRLAMEAAICEIVRANHPDPEMSQGLKETCSQLLVAEGQRHDHEGRSLAFWPHRPTAKLKSPKYLPSAKGYISDEPTEETALRFFENNPQLAPSVREHLTRWLKRGSRLETFYEAGGEPIPSNHILVEIYPDNSIFWISPNLVALREDVERLSRSYDCVQRVIKLRTFLSFGFDPEHQFAPNKPHNVLGFLCNAEETVKAGPDDHFIVKLRRAMSFFCSWLHCEDENDPTWLAGNYDDEDEPHYKARTRTA